MLLSRRSVCFTVSKSGYDTPSGFGRKAIIADYYKNVKLSFSCNGHAVLVECAAVDVILLGLEAGDDVLAIVKLHQNHQHQIAADEGAIVVAAILPTGCLATSTITAVLIDCFIMIMVFY